MKWVFYSAMGINKSMLSCNVSVNKSPGFWLEHFEYQELREKLSKMQSES